MEAEGRISGGLKGMGYRVGETSEKEENMKIKCNDECI